ncbi:MAG TPA: hypothetical protein VNG93_04965 [Candidatus Dormibacteraeota bacterium]|nr:hypothetical protein [Candidatus Dormibacteraeota bacterium]
MTAGGLSAGAGSRKLEYVSDVVLELARENPDASPDAAGEVTVTLKIAKSRYGPAGETLTFGWCGRRQRYSA